MDQRKGGKPCAVGPRWTIDENHLGTRLAQEIAEKTEKIEEQVTKDLHPEHAEKTEKIEEQDE